MMIWRGKTNNLFQLYHFKYWYQSTKLLICYSRMWKKCCIITHYKIHVHNHYNRFFFLSEHHISSFSLGALQPVSDFLITSTAEVFPLYPTAHCEKRAVLCSLQRSQNASAMATGAAPPMTCFDSDSFWLAVHSFHASLNVLGKTLSINCTIIHNCCHSLTDDWC